MATIIQPQLTEEQQIACRRSLDAEIAALPKEVLTGLTYFGYVTTPKKPFNKDNFPEREVAETRLQIRRFLKKSKTFYRGISSYGFKHICEDIYRNAEIAFIDYVANGTFILAMLLEGFKVERIPNTPNAYFNVTKAGAKKFTEAAGHCFLG